MRRFVRTDSRNPDFIKLNGLLDAELAIRDGEEHAFYAQYNTVEDIHHIVLAYEDNEPVGCGAIKGFEPGTMEIKRMFVPAVFRKKGIASEILIELERWAAELETTSCILETGKKQPEAISLYEKHGYKVIPNYGQYEGMDNSVCFEKKLSNGEYYHTADSVEEYIRLAAGHNGLPLINELRPYLKEGASVLEIGSGPGTDWKVLSENYVVTGSDNSAEFIKHLKSSYPEGNFILLDAATLQTEQKFEAIYSNKVLHHLTDQQLAYSVKRQSETLSPQGIVCHSFWKGEGSECFKGMFVNYHTNEELLLLFEPHFEVLVIKDYKEFEEGDSTLIIGRKK